MFGRIQNGIKREILDVANVVILNIQNYKQD